MCPPSQKWRTLHSTEFLEFGAWYSCFWSFWCFVWIKKRNGFGSSFLSRYWFLTALWSSTFCFESAVISKMASTPIFSAFQENSGFCLWSLLSLASLLYSAAGLKISSPLLIMWSLYPCGFFFSALVAMLQHGFGCLQIQMVKTALFFTLVAFVSRPCLEQKNCVIQYWTVWWKDKTISFDERDWSVCFGEETKPGTEPSYMVKN